MRDAYIENFEIYYIEGDEKKYFGKTENHNIVIANYELTALRRKKLDIYDIGQVFSNDELVWSRTDEKINEKTKKKYDDLVREE